MLNIFSIEPRVVSRLILILIRWCSGELDVDLGVLFFAIGFALKRLFIVLNDMGSLEPDDHGQARHSSVDSVGDLQTIVKTVERTAQVKVLVSLLAEQSVAQDSHRDCLVAAF